MSALSKADQLQKQEIKRLTDENNAQNEELQKLKDELSET